MLDGGMVVAVFVSKETFDDVCFSKNVAAGFFPGNSFMYCAISNVWDNRNISTCTRLSCSVMWESGRLSVAK